MRIAVYAHLPEDHSEQIAASPLYPVNNMLHSVAAVTVQCGVPVRLAVHPVVLLLKCGVPSSLLLSSVLLLLQVGKGCQSVGSVTSLKRPSIPFSGVRVQRGTLKRPTDRATPSNGGARERRGGETAGRSRGVAEEASPQPDPPPPTADGHRHLYEPDQDAPPAELASADPWDPHREQLFRSYVVALPRATQAASDRQDQLVTVLQQRAAVLQPSSCHS